MNKQEIAELTKNDDSEKKTFEERLQIAVDERIAARDAAEKGIIREGNGVKLSVHDAGTFTDPKTGQLVEFEAGIKIKVGAHYVKPDAVQLSFLYRAIQDKEVNAELRKRLAEEQAKIKELSF